MATPSKHDIRRYRCFLFKMLHSLTEIDILKLNEIAKRKKKFLQRKKINIEAINESRNEIMICECLEEYGYICWRNLYLFNIYI